MTFRWLDFDQAEIDLREDGTLISYILARPLRCRLSLGAG